MSLKNPSLELGKLVTELRSTIEDKNKNISEIKEKTDRMEKDLFSFEQENQKLNAKIAEQKKITDALEKHAIHSHNINNNDADAILNPELVEAFNNYFLCRDTKTITSTDDNVRKYFHLAPDVKVLLPTKNNQTKNFLDMRSVVNSEIERKYLRTDVGDAGGFLIPPEYVPTMLRRLTEYSPIRQFASTRTTYSNVALLPLRNTLVTAFWGAEGQNPIDISQSQYIRADVPMKRLQVKVPITIEDLMDSPFDMQAEISNDVNEAFAQLEGSGFINGDGIKQVEGIMTNPNIKRIASGKASDITTDSIMQMFGEIKWKSYANLNYDRTYMFNRRTWVRILQMKDGGGRYVWSQGNISAGIPNSILGASYVISPDMDDISAGTYPIVMGDFKKGYMIMDRMLMYMVRDEVTNAGTINFNFIRRLGAQVVIPEAFVKMQVAAS